MRADAGLTGHPDFMQEASSWYIGVAVDAAVTRHHTLCFAMPASPCMAKLQSATQQNCQADQVQDPKPL